MNKKIDPKRRALRPVPDPVRSPPLPIPTRIELSEEEKKTIQELNQKAQSYQNTLGGLRLQIMELETNELDIASRLQDAQTKVITATQDIMKARGVPVGTPQAGHWKMDFATMLLERDDLPAPPPPADLPIKPEG